MSVVPKVLFTSPVFAHPAKGGPTLRIENTVKALSRVAQLHVICRVAGRELGGSRAIAFYNSICRKFVFMRGKGSVSQFCFLISAKRFRISPRIAYLFVNGPFKFLQAVLRVLPLTDEAGFLVRYARRHKIRIIWFGYGNVSYPLIQEVHRRAPDLRLICDTDSVWSRFVLRELRYQTDPEKKRRIEQKGRAKEIEEREWVNVCDVTTAVSDVDAEYYRSLATDAERIRVFSNVVDLKTYQHVREAPRDFKKPCIYLAGSFWHGSPMEHAARWVLRDVLPRLRDQWPDLHFYIVGNRSDKVLGDVQSDRVTVTGRVESVLPYLCNADVVLVPLWFESGTRFKILEAGACRKAVVSTTLGAEGLPVTDEHDILIADTPDDFAKAISRVLLDTNTSNVLGENLCELVSRNYSIESLCEEGTRILEFLNLSISERTQGKVEWPCLA